MNDPFRPVRSALTSGRLALVLLTALSPGAAPGAPVDVAAPVAVPTVGEHTLLSWREGPPYFTTARYSSDRRFLRLETGHFAAELDTEAAALTGFAHFPVPRAEAAATRAALAAAPLPPSQLHLSITVGGTVYTCTGRRAIAFDAHGLPALPLEFPVRIIESGRYFQKILLHDLEFRDPAGRRPALAARLEISAWPDRLALTLVVRPGELLPRARAFLRLTTSGGRDASIAETAAIWEASVDHRVSLTLNADGSALAPGAPAGQAVRVAPTDPEARATVHWNPEELCHQVGLEAVPWPSPEEGIYPQSRLDSWETHEVTLENESDAPQAIALNFVYHPIKSITSFVPVWVDLQGNPTGLPVQVSKNWHVSPSGTDLPYAGQWMHGRTRLNLPPRSRLSLRLGTAYARWGGLPTASLAQLSLVGWGHNGFWDQFALGAFGETICFQPGRAMRRALFTDFRPLFQRGFARNERWAWTGNVGGGDTMVRHDAQGRYVPFRRNVTRYASHGPNLAHLVHEELSADDAVRSRVEVLLPRTDDCARIFLRLHYEVLQRAPFSRLALFQLGADLYTDADAPLIAWGDARGLIAENRPPPASGARLLPLWEARGDQPWISLHGQPRADLERNGQASRGLVVREWRAVLGGRDIPAPFFAAVGSRGAKSRLAAEIVPPASLTALEPGDRVDLLLELLALPLTAERYYGPNTAFAAALASDANTWRLVHREAAGNRPSVQLADGSVARGWPLAVPAGATREVAFTLRGGLGWLPVHLTGLARPDGIELFRTFPAGQQRVVQGDPDRAYWQSDYNATTGRWSATYNLPAAPDPVTYVARLPAAKAAAPPSAVPAVPVAR